MCDVLRSRRCIAALRAAVAALVIAVGVVGTATRSEAVSTTVITLDGRSSYWPVEDVAGQIQTDCKGVTERVTVKFVGRDRSFGATFHCVDVNGHPASVVPELLALASQQPGVRRRANRVAAIDNALRPDQRVGYGPTPADLAWALATGSDGRCGSADNLKRIRADMTSAANTVVESPEGTYVESPERWTLVEAVWIAGVCPEQLSTLLGSVTRLGHPEAATAVKQTIEQARDSIR